jgi:lipoprotein-releasing system permease protein
MSALPTPGLNSIPGWLPFEWLLAFRFLREGKVQTLFIVGGVAIGVGVTVFMSALMTGLQANFVKRVLTGQAHIQLLPPKEIARILPPESNEVSPGSIVQAPLQRAKSIDQWQTLVIQMNAIPEIKVVSPSVSGSALAVRGSASRAITVLGVDPNLYFQIVPMQEKMIHGHANLTVNDILIGSELANDLGLSVGDKFRASAANGNSNTFLISGIFDLGNKSANARTSMMAMRSAQSLLGLTGGVTSIDITVKDVYAAEVVAQKSRPKLAFKLTVGSKQTSNFSPP